MCLTDNDIHYVSAPGGLFVGSRNVNTDRKHATPAEIVNISDL